jgi:hypothetical protein
MRNPLKTLKTHHDAIVAQVAILAALLTTARTLMGLPDRLKALWESHRRYSVQVGSWRHTELFYRLLEHLEDQKVVGAQDSRHVELTRMDEGGTQMPTMKRQAVRLGGLECWLTLEELQDTNHMGVARFSHRASISVATPRDLQALQEFLWGLLEVGELTLENFTMGLAHKRAHDGRLGWRYRQHPQRHAQTVALRDG